METFGTLCQTSINSNLCQNTDLGVAIWIDCLLSSNVQFASLTEAFIEPSDNILTAADIKPNLNSASFKRSSL